jgi:hypothetical protein
MSDSWELSAQGKLRNCTKPIMSSINELITGTLAWLDLGIASTKLP